MLPKQHRLQKDKEIAKVFRKGANYFSKHLVLKTAKNQGGTTRFAFIISKKVNKKATRRNYLKRHLRAVVGRLLFELKSGYDVIVLAKYDFDFPYKQSEIEQELVLVLKKASLLNSENNSDKNNRAISKNSIA